MGKLIELNEKPSVVINGERYIPEELYKEYLIERLEDEKQICRRFAEKVDTELMTGYWDNVDCDLIISREDLRDIVKRVLAEMEQVE